MRISINELISYIKCPLYYKFKFVDCFNEERDLKSYYREYIKLSIFYFYFSMIEDKIKPFDAMIRKWESLWFSSDMQNRFGEEDLRHNSNEAIMVLRDFYKHISKEEATPIAVNFSYETIFAGEKNLIVYGDIDLIKILNDRTRQKETQIIFFTTSLSEDDGFLLKNDISLTIASHAFRHDFKKKEDRLLMCNILKNSSTPTMRSSGDFKRAESIVRNICNGIDNKVFFPVPNKIHCSRCKYKLFCIHEKAIG